MRILKIESVNMGELVAYFTMVKSPMGWWDDSAGKGVCHQVWAPEPGWQEEAPTAAHTPRHAQAFLPRIHYTCTKAKYMQQNSKMEYIRKHGRNPLLSMTSETCHSCSGSFLSTLPSWQPLCTLVNVFSLLTDTQPRQPCWFRCNHCVLTTTQSGSATSAGDMFSL